MMLRKVKLIDFVLCCKYSVRSGAGGPKQKSFTFDWELYPPFDPYQFCVQ